MRELSTILGSLPILTRAISEETGNHFEKEHFYLGTTSLAQMSQLYAEAGAIAFGKMYSFGPTFGTEKSKSRRLTEFWMVEPEMTRYDWEEPGVGRGERV